MKIKKVNTEEFQEKLESVKRFWNQDSQEGEARNQASQQLKDSCVYIFIRDDGWSIASPWFGPAYKLWAEEWETMYELEAGLSRRKGLEITECRQREPDSLIHVIKGAEGERIQFKGWAYCEQPEEIEDDEHNVKVSMGAGETVYAKSIDLEFRSKEI